MANLMKVCTHLNSFSYLLTSTARVEVILEAFVMQSSVANLNYLNNEDIVAALQGFSNRYLPAQTQAGHPPTLLNPDTFKSHFLSELYRTIGVRADYTIDSQLSHLLSTNQGLYLQRCLSVQAALGCAGWSHRPSLSATLAWMTLNTRFLVMVFMGTIGPRKPGVESEMGRPGTHKIPQRLQREG